MIKNFISGARKFIVDFLNFNFTPKLDPKVAARIEEENRYWQAYLDRIEENPNEPCGECEDGWYDWGMMGHDYCLCILGKNLQKANREAYLEKIKK